MRKVAIKKKIKEGLSDKSARLGRTRAFALIRPAMKRMIARYPNLRDKVRGIKEYSINNLPALLEQAINSLKEKGCEVFVANSAEEASRYIGQVVQEGLVVKSKTNAGKEIGITKYLEEQGAEVIETDLGDRITQLAKCNASHTLAPAIHIPIEKVAELLSEEAGEKIERDENALVKAARKSLRKYLEEADVGISGANAIVAETGSIFLTENEGNIRAVTSMPRIHIAIAGVEKIVPQLSDGITVVKAAASFGVGQDIGTYTSVISGPSRYTNDELDFLGHGQGPEEVHVVFLKEGRDKAIEESFGESLYCINCGSCLNFCPIYSEIGDRYGYKYLGGQGAVFSAFHADLEKAQEAGLFLCIGCQKCQEVCSVGMKTPEMISRLRAKVVEERGLEWSKKSVFSILTRNKLPQYMKLARHFQDLGLRKTADSKSATLRFGLPSLGLARDRLVSPIARKSFWEIIKNRKAVDRPKMRVAFFAGCMINYLQPEIGMDLLDVLGAFGVEVMTFEEEACCGLPVLSSGATREAMRLARQNVKLLTRDAYEYLLFVCPSCATTVKKEWGKLLEKENDEILEKYKSLAQKVMDINRFLVGVLNIQPPELKIEAKVTYHDPCHLVRGLEIRDEPRKLLRAISGTKFVEMEDADTCCGFGGSFSLFYYDLARQINSEKVNKIKATEADYLVTSCPGCIMHIADGIHHAGGSQKIFHIIELLARVFKEKRRQ